MTGSYITLSNLSSAIDGLTTDRYIICMDGRARLRERLDEVMRDRNLSLREAAEQIGVSHGSLSNLRDETKTPSPETLRKLAPFLGEDLDTLLVWAGHKPAPTAPETHPDIWLRADPKATPDEIDAVLPTVIANARAAIEQYRRTKKGD